MFSKTVYTAALVILIGSLTSCDGERLGSSRIDTLLMDTRTQHTDDDQFSADLEDIATELANGDLSGLRETLNYLRNDVENEEMETHETSVKEMSRTTDMTVNPTEEDFLSNNEDESYMSMSSFGGAPDMTPDQERDYMNIMEDTEEEYNYEEIPVSSPEE